VVTLSVGEAAAEGVPAGAPALREAPALPLEPALTLGGKVPVRLAVWLTVAVGEVL
jgi:hypothetical protein